MIRAQLMELEKLFNQQFLYDLSFFNFENAITATYFADADLNIIKVNKNFKSFLMMMSSLRVKIF